MYAMHASACVWLVLRECGKSNAWLAIVDRGKECCAQKMRDYGAIE